MDRMLTFIISVILGFYILGYIGRLLLRGWVRRQQKNFYRRGDAPKHEKRPEEGKITVETIHAEKKVSRNVGDYVEYEEVEITGTTEETSR